MLRIILVRHAKAQKREKAKAAGISDKNRPLTPKGIREFSKHIIKNKKYFKNVDLWISSPYVRAKETMDVLLSALNLENPQIKIFSKITPDDNIKFIFNFIKRRSEKKIVIVSHEPYLSNFVNAVQGVENSVTVIKKGGIISVDYDQENNKFKFKKLINP